MTKERDLLQRLIDAVGDCRETDAILEIVDETEKLLHPRICSFCKRTEHDVDHLIVANKGLAICNGCVDLSRKTIKEHKKSKSREQ